MASPTWWTWVRVNSGSWWWTGRPGVLWLMDSQRAGHDWATELNWNEVFSLQMTKISIGYLYLDVIQVSQTYLHKYLYRLKFYFAHSNPDWVFFLPSAFIQVCHYYASNLDLKFGCDFGPSQDFNHCFQMFPVPSHLTLVASFMSFLSFKHHGHHSISYSNWKSCVLHNFMCVIHKEYVMNSIPWCFVPQNLQKYAQLSCKY